MSVLLPKFDAPPVIETVLSAQFARLERFSNAHGGWFWKSYLNKDWVNVQSAPRLEDQFERFGDEFRWGPSAGGIRIVTGAESARLQILRADDERMIQIQDSRFVYNWRKQNADYPSYENVLSEFLREFANFERFIKDAELGAMDLNQWEVTYVNHIDRGGLWNAFSDWIKIFPRFYAPAEGESDINPEDFGGEWKLTIGDNLGRLHVALSRGRVASEKGAEVIRLQLTARGPVNMEKGLDLRAGFELGHAVIVRYFTAMTSPVAHKYWKRRV
jgi:uncharacterized protein (TIGR04255 family)